MNYLFIALICCSVVAKTLDQNDPNNPLKHKKSNGKKLKKTKAAKEKIESTKREAPEVAMSFSREELFDKSPHEISNAYVRIYQAIGETLRLSHRYNVIDAENQKGINYIAHMINHIAKQSNSVMDKSIIESVTSKLSTHDKEMKEIHSLTKEIKESANKAALKIAEYEIAVHSIQDDTTTPFYIYMIILTLQLATGYFIYIIAFKRKNIL
ncbi:GOLD domain-containing protein [Entamoeba marina]